MCSMTRRAASPDSWSRRDALGTFGSRACSELSGAKCRLQCHPEKRSASVATRDLHFRRGERCTSCRRKVVMNERQGVIQTALRSCWKPLYIVVDDNSRGGNAAQALQKLSMVEGHDVVPSSR